MLILAVMTLSTSIHALPVIKTPLTDEEIGSRCDSDPDYYLCRQLLRKFQSG